jgi:hypothetical protein
MKNSTKTSGAQSAGAVNHLNLNLPKKWVIDLECQARLVDNLSTYRASYFTLETGYNRLFHVIGFTLRFKAKIRGR